MASAMMVDTGGYLLFNNVMFSDIANATAYTYRASQPYVNKGVGYGLWPTIALAPQALVSWCVKHSGIGGHLPSTLEHFVSC
jgi:hypothetical protein